ncbi:MAG: DUF1836 domain-containing protein [Clostridia bacterium]|nr:DUF1836 domain-containing protein [Clostridia bacterium]
MIENEQLDFHIPRWNELPDIDLYLDQVVTFLDKYLSNYIDYDIDKKDKDEKEDKASTCITKTMINNYVKQNIIEPPVKKKYNKRHLASLFVICILKQVYSISDIDKLIKLSQKNFPTDRAYNTFCHALEKSIEHTFSGKSYLNNRHLSPETYLLLTVVQTFASKLYVEKNYLKF